MQPRQIKSTVLLLLIVSANAFAQSNFLNKALKQYPFINDRASVIENATELDSFFFQLHHLEVTDSNSISIIHIGDSHIQAGFFTTPARIDFSKQFGNAGRGLIFPYRLAKSNGPSDYISSSEYKWTYQRNAVRVETLPTGITGFAIGTDNSNA